MMELIAAFVLGIIEGLTEFLPISSTGHQIIAADLLDFTGQRAIAFNIIIQLAAILAVMWEFRCKIVQVIRDLPYKVEAQSFALNILLAFLPAVFFGLLLADIIHQWLFNPITVAAALVIGGCVILLIDRPTYTANSSKITLIEQVTPYTALKIGLAQCLALIPGTSRSAATIVGGLVCGLSRQIATEFSFFLAMPTMVAAAVYSAYKYRDSFVFDDLPIFALGFITSFICAKLTVKALLAFIAQHSYAVFAYYRIIFGVLILATWYFGWINWHSL